MKRALSLPASSTDAEHSVAPRPGENVLEAWSRWALIGIFIVLAGVVLAMARDFVIPVISAMILGSMAGPLAEKLQGRGVPFGVTAFLLLLTLAAAVYGLVLVVSVPITEWIARGPELQTLIHEKLAVVQRPLARVQAFFEALRGIGAGPGAVTVDVASGDLVSRIAGVLTPAIGELIVFFGAFVFYVIDRRGIRHRVAGVFHEREDRLKSLKIFTEIETELRSYLSVVTLINLGMGLATAALCLAVGLPSFYLWGILAFILNYAPYIGPGLMTLILALVSLASFQSLGQALLAPGGFMVLALIEGHILTPGIVGRYLTLKPFLVFLSVAFWTWLWGPVGTLLATPILIVGLVVLRSLHPKDEIKLPG